MPPQIFKDVAEELIETGAGAVAQAKQQASPTKMIGDVMEQLSGGGTSSLPPGFEDLKGKGVSSSQLAKMKQDDAQKTAPQLSQVRGRIGRMIIQRYQKMQQEILRVHQQKEEEERRKKEEEEYLAQRKKEEEEKQKQQGAVALPKGPKKKGLFGIFFQQKQGTGEIRSVKSN